MANYTHPAIAELLPLLADDHDHQHHELTLGELLHMIRIAEQFLDAHPLLDIQQLAVLLRGQDQ